jgi:spermidine/putrescine transport system substrate-binding protein
MKTNIIMRSAAAALTLGLVAVACGSDDGDSSDTTADTATEEASADTAAEEVATEDTGAEDTAAESDVETVACGVDETDGNLAIYNWAEYIDEEELAAFSDEYGISVTMDTYDSNEAMQPIISAGNSGYDLIVPSDYMVTILTAAGSIQALNQAAIPNMANLLPEFTDLDYDPGNLYSAPYQWGTTGMALNTAVVGADYEPTWGLIFDPELAGQFSGQISLLNDPRETMGAALKYLGYSLNTTSEEELDEATALVSAARDNLAAFDTDQADELLVNGETVIAHGYSGDMFVQFLEADNPSDFVYFVPQEGGARWVDTIAIPFDAPHPCSAHTFINWLLTAEHGAALTNWNYYSTPNEAALGLLDDELVAFLTDPSLVVGGVESLEQFVDTGDFEINYSDAFIEAKG